MSTRPPSPYEQNRIAKIRLDPTTLATLLDLPDGLRVERIHTEYDPMGITITVSGESLPVLPPDSYAPPLGDSVFGMEVKIIDGRPFYRWNWSRG